MRRTIRPSGFTLIEAMIATAIIGVLAATTIPAYSNYQARSKRSEAYANLAAIAKLEKGYYGEYNAYVPSGGVSWPGGAAPSASKRIWTAASDAPGAFGQVGFHPDGAVYYDYEVNVDTTTCPGADCFTTTAYGDADGNGKLSMVMYVQPNAAGNFATSLAFPGLGVPTDPITGNRMLNEVAVNYAADPY